MDRFSEESPARGYYLYMARLRGDDTTPYVEPDDDSPCDIPVLEPISVKVAVANVEEWKVA